MAGSESTNSISYSSNESCQRNENHCGLNEPVTDLDSVFQKSADMTNSFSNLVWSFKSSFGLNETVNTVNSHLTSVVLEKESEAEASQVEDEKSKNSIQDFIPLCRLCASPCHSLSSIKLFQYPPHHPELLAGGEISVALREEERGVLDMIRSLLPIKVSCCDSLPKQVCQICLDRLYLTHSFKQSVLEAEKHLQLLSISSSDGKLSGFSSNLHRTYYDCPVCIEADKSSQAKVEVIETSPSTTKYVPNNGNILPEIAIKVEPEDIFEPSYEELEQTYQTLFRNPDSPSRYLSEDHVPKKSMRPLNEVKLRPKDRPHPRPKLTPRSRRGRHRTCTTVERILELNEKPIENEDWYLEVCISDKSPTPDTLTQCLLCERWFPEVASCLQHCLKEHLDSGAFLCPLCPRDDFPGDFELIEHYQEAHCPDLVLYESYKDGRGSFVSNDADQKALLQQPDPVQSSVEKFLYPQETPWNARSCCDNNPESNLSTISHITSLGNYKKSELVCKNSLEPT